MFKNIMIAVDGSAYTESVINHAIALARLFSSHVLVLTVVDVRIFEWASAVGADGFVTIVPSGIYQDESLSILDEKCEKILHKCRALLEKNDIKFKLEKMVGSPVESILEKAQIADLVIMGKRGEFERWDKNELGVTVQAISRNIIKPLLVVKKECRPLQKILLGYDGSEHAGKALQITANLAERLNAHLTVVSATIDSDNGQRICNEAIEYLSSYSIKVDTAVLSGDPNTELVHYAQQSDIDLIAIGAFGHSRIREVILGSTTEHILRFFNYSGIVGKIRVKGKNMAIKSYIADVGKYLGQDVTIQGWVYNHTHKGKLHFVMLRDGTDIIQAVLFRDTVGEAAFEQSLQLTLESSLTVTGTVSADKRAKGGYELAVKEISIQQIAPEYPISPKEHGIDFLMENRHLWLRSTLQHSIMKVRHEVIKACRDYFDGLGFTLIDAPIFTPAACEGTTTLFETNYFDSKAYLTQSGQLYMEAAAMAFGKVYCFGPTFRAEKSKTRRHLTEFWMIEPEMAFCDLEQDMSMAEGLIARIVERVLENRRPELERLERDLKPLEAIKTPFPRMTYDQAAEILKKENPDFIDGDDFGAPDETILSQKHSSPLMITHYPAAVKAFYMKADTVRPDRALCVDVLAPEGYGEIIGGGQREDDLNTLLHKIQAHKLPEEAFAWYLDLRKYGSVPHAGFGMGIERTVTWLCGLKHIRETIPFPRTMSRIYP